MYEYMKMPLARVTVQTKFIVLFYSYGTASFCNTIQQIRRIHLSQDVLLSQSQSVFIWVEFVEVIL